MAITLIGRSNIGTANERWLTDTNEAQRTATEVFLIKGNECTGGAYDSETDIAAALPGLGVPNLAEVATDNPGMFCVNRQIRLQPGSENIWEVTCQFDNNPRRGLNAGGDDGGDGSASWAGAGVPVSPFAELAQVSMTVDEVEIQTLDDRNGRLISTSVGEVLDGAVKKLPVAVLEVEQLEQFVNITSVMQFVGKLHVGSTFVGGFGDHEILFSDFTARPTSVDGINGYRCTYQFRCLARGAVSDSPSTILRPPVAGGAATPATGTDRVGWRMVYPNYGSVQAGAAHENTAMKILGVPRWWLNSSGVFCKDGSGNPSLVGATYMMAALYETFDANSNLSLRI